MSLYAIADLHLSIGTLNKEMDIFGEIWQNHTQKIEQNWRNTVTEDDTVVIAGDICWATGMENARLDLEFIHNLPGRQKIILKGNHDYWWNTVTKLDNFVRECGFHTLKFLHNDASAVAGGACFQNQIICGTRGWMLEENPENTDNHKIFKREKIRLELSLQKAAKLAGAEIIVFMHYPPVTKNSGNTDFLDIMRKFGVRRCYYGHLHAQSHKNAVIGEVDGVELQLVSCDYINFTPVKVLNT